MTSVDGNVDEPSSCSPAAAADCCLTSSSQPTSSETVLSSEPRAVDTELRVSEADIRQEQAESSSDSGDCRAEDRVGLLACNELTLILRLQRDLATMQLQLSNLQDAMRTANATLQLLLQRAFNGYN